MTPLTLSPMTVVLPMPPTLTNSGRGRSRHWRAVERERRTYLAYCDAAQAAGLVPPPPPTPIPRATLRSVMHLGGHMDDDGAVSRHKWALDWLVTRGYLLTDRRSGLRWEAFPEQVVSRKHAYELRLTITPVAVALPHPAPAAP